MTDSSAGIVFQNDFFVVSGELNFTTVVALWNNSLRLLTQAPQLNFDFTQVTASNSAGLALILEWMKYAKQHNKSIRFNNIPKQLNSIIAISGIANMLGTAAAQSR
jgi:phospholipid transport system transporter-binding protein